jgi:hypothetical protein
MEKKSSIKARFALQCVEPGPWGFEILAMTAGVGNGWEFGAGVLAESLPLWNGVECFIDHDLKHRSVKDLAGLCEMPVWDEQAKGVRLVLRAVGPASAVLVETGKEVIQTLQSGKAAPNVGFSADILFSAEGKKVTKIQKVLSLDLVYSPARGGKFIRSLNQNLEDKGMEEEEMVNHEGHKEHKEENIKDALTRELMAQKEAAAQMAAQTEAAQKVRAEMCGYLLDSALSASHLPQAMAERIRKQFSGRVFEPAELTTALEDGRKLVTELTAGASVQGMGRVQMFDSKDQLQAAADDLLGRRGMRLSRVRRCTAYRAFVSCT